MYKIIYKLHLNGNYDSPWLMCIKRLLCHSWNPDFWNDQDILSPKSFMKNVVALQLENHFIQNWDFETNHNRKCVAYRIFKDKIKLEPYLTELDFVDRRALCKFRTGNHRLPVAKSRYTIYYMPGRGGDEIICKLCESNDICDEFHVLFLCKYFDEHRKKYLKKNVYTRPSTLKCTHFLTLVVSNLSI